MKHQTTTPQHTMENKFDNEQVSNDYKSSESSEVKTKSTSENMMKIFKRQSKSNESIQQSFLIGILNYFSNGFKLKSAERKARKTIQLLTVSEIHKEGQIIQYENYINQLANEYTMNELNEYQITNVSCDDIEKISSITKISNDLNINKELLMKIKRHRDQNKNSLSMNLLLETVTQLGFDFDKRYSKPSTLTIKMNKIASMTCPFKMKKDEISVIGRNIHKYITGLNSQKGIIYIQPNDPNIAKFLNFDELFSNVESKGTNENMIMNQPEIKIEMNAITDENIGIDENKSNNIYVKDNDSNFNGNVVQTVEENNNNYESFFNNSYSYWDINDAWNDDVI